MRLGKVLRGRRTALAAAIVAVLALTNGALMFWDRGGASSAEARTVREYVLEIDETTIDYGNGGAWQAWTFNGTVPGPTLRVKVGEILRVRVVNNHEMTHSFHTHLTNYRFEMDGSQANVFGQIGQMGMIPPGGEFVYEFEATTPGIYYYHCHSAHGGLAINQHILQGLYGAIIVEGPDDPPMREEVLFMSEMGRGREGNAPFFLMNGLGHPGGEHALEELYHEEGLEGILGTLGKTVPYFEVKVNEPIKLHVINIGNQEHTLHIHNVNHYSLGALGGRPWPANVVPLLQGQADTLLINFTQPGIWLFHCHVVPHADAGMIGLFIVDE